MITLFIWSILNGLFIHIDPELITDDMRMIITIIGLASDLNMLAICAIIEILCNLRNNILINKSRKAESEE